MRSKKRPTGQLNFLSPYLNEQLTPKNELYLLADAVDWGYFEKEFTPLYSDKGRPAHPILRRTEIRRGFPISNIVVPMR